MRNITYYNMLFIVENNLQKKAYSGKYSSILYAKGYKISE